MTGAEAARTHMLCNAHRLEAAVHALWAPRGMRTRRDPLDRESPLRRIAGKSASQQTCLPAPQKDNDLLFSRERMKIGLMSFEGFFSVQDTDPEDPAETLDELWRSNRG